MLWKDEKKQLTSQEMFYIFHVSTPEQVTSCVLHKPVIIEVIKESSMLGFREVMTSCGTGSCFCGFLVRCAGTSPDAHRDLL